MTNPSAFAQKLESHIRENRDRLVATLIGWGVTAARAEDLLHDAVEKAIAARSQLDDDAQLEGWFHRVLRNTTIDFHRSKRREWSKNRKWARESTQFVVPKFKSQTCQCFHDVIPTMKAEYAEAIRRVDLQEGELRDVATRLGITYNNLKVRLHRARRQLRSRLQKTCASCAEQGCLDCTCGS